MTVECVFFGPLRDAVGRKTVAVETDAATVRELLGDLESGHDGLDGALLASGGEALAEEVAVTVNGKHVQQLGGADTAIADGDVVRFTTAVYGG